MSEEIKSSYPNIKYVSDVNQDSKAIIENCCSDLVNKSSKNIDFFSKINIFVDKRFGKKCLKNVNNKDYFIEFSSSSRSANGLFVPPGLNNGSLDVFIRTNRGSKKIKYNDLNFNVTHEVAHAFDYYFGENHDDKTIEILSNFKNYSGDDKEFLELQENYLNTCYLSDTEEFKEAWKTDVEKLGQLNSSQRKQTEKRLGYINPTNYSKIDITDGVDEEEMTLADTDRMETFAQLFSFALGNEAPCLGDATVAKEVFSNTYEVVKKYMNKFLGIECQ